LEGKVILQGVQAEPGPGGENAPSRGEAAGGCSASKCSWRAGNPANADGHCGHFIPCSELASLPLKDLAAAGDNGTVTRREDNG